jgi:hypothetical protein
MNNPSLRKSLSLLTHPLSITAILVLVINDHFLRVYYPSWITGKLGDFAWLFFSPLALAAILAIIIPKHLNRNSQTIILLSIGLISGIFLLGKTSAQVNAWMREGMGLLLRQPVSLYRDPSDLIALIATGGTYITWKRNKMPEKASYMKGLAVLFLSAALTIANAAEPDYGITCLEIIEDRLIAWNNRYDSYESRDGGYSWQLVRIEDECSCDPYYKEEIFISSPENDQFLFRTDDEGKLVESQDGGKTWTAVSGIQPLSQAEVAWLEQTRSVYYQPGPLFAVSDPGSGNLVFAMGLEGVLVRTGGGEWILVAVDEYQLVNLSLESIPGLLKYEIFLAAAFALLLLITGGIFSGSSLFQKIWLGLVWMIWLFTQLFFQPALRNGYDLIIINAGVIFVAVSVLVLIALYLSQAWETFKTRWVALVGLVLAGFFVAIFPYLLWALNIISDYRWSLALSLCLGLTLLAVLIIWQGGWGVRGGKK